LIQPEYSSGGGVAKLALGGVCRGRAKKELGDTLSSLGGKLTLGEASGTRLGST